MTALRTMNIKWWLNTAGIFFLFLLLSMDAMLRFFGYENVSISKLLVGVMLAISAFLWPARTIVFALVTTFVLIYSFLIASVSDYGFVYTTFRYSLHFFLVAASVFLGYQFQKNSDDFTVRFVYGALFYTMLAAALLAYFFGFQFPNIPPDDRFAQAWFWNQNDICMLLASIGFFMILSGQNENRITKFLYMVSFCLLIILVIINKALLVSLSLAVFIFVFVIYKVVLFVVPRSDRYAKKAIFIYCILLFGAVGCSFAIAFGALHYFEPIGRLLTLQPYQELAGSIYNRTDATIFSIKEFFYSNGLGVGFGNSMEMLASDKYGELRSLITVHNILIQLVVELGVLAVITMFFVVYKSGLEVSVVFWMPFAINSISQSGAIVSNYVFWLVFGSALFVSFRKNCIRFDGLADREIS